MYIYNYIYIFIIICIHIYIYIYNHGAAHGLICLPKCYEKVLDKCMKVKENTGHLRKLKEN